MNVNTINMTYDVIMTAIPVGIAFKMMRFWNASKECTIFYVLYSTFLAFIGFVGAIATFYTDSHVTDYSKPYYWVAPYMLHKKLTNVPYLFWINIIIFFVYLAGRAANKRVPMQRETLWYSTAFIVCGILNFLNYMNDHFMER